MESPRAPEAVTVKAPGQGEAGPVVQASPGSSPAPEPERGPAATDAERTLGQLLAAHRFRDATALYYREVHENPGSMPLLRPTVDAWVQRCLKNCDDFTLLDFIDTWLATFYDDIPMLLTLAEYQEQQGQPEAAANTLLLARTYALSAGDRWAVTAALNRLTRRTDENLSREERWIELVGYYEFLAAIDLDSREFELRRALLYRHLGEQARASELLAALRDADRGDDPQWTATLERHLAEPPTGTMPGISLTDAVPLERHGNGYLAEITLNDRDTLRLLIDTGASMTALNHASFRRLYRPGLRLLGSRLFNTANGYTRGDVYQASALTLGQERIEGVDIAVLDFQIRDEIDGLLGMNVLRQFSFEIDQSAGVLHLERR